ncbi:MAG: class I SAM-dependent methyltransferase [Candidatus Bathyarchaeota archaeon]|nr:class I SAM-dependent methyltransferase [Candidatus Bathyarchaeota archaeon]
MKREYFYPDVNDKITEALVKEKEPFQGYWEKSERKILDYIKQTIKKHFIKCDISWLLDAGCGTGRLLPEFQQYFTNILALDPDSKQIAKARNVAERWEFKDKILFKATSAERLRWKKESVDVILCSHIIQHVHTETIPKILKKFNDILKQNGLLFILTTHSRKNRDSYAKATLEGAKSIEKEIRIKEFNLLISNNQNILPIHFFSVDQLSKNLKDCGFVVLDFRSYHVYSKSKLLAKDQDNDDLVNSSVCLKLKFGRDILLIGQKSTK